MRADGVRDDDAPAFDADALDARSIMRRQASASLPVAAAFIAFLLLLPLLNRYARGAMETQIGPFPLNWLLLAALVYPFTWTLARIFVRRSERAEAEIVAAHRREEA